MISVTATLHLWIGTSVGLRQRIHPKRRAQVRQTSYVVCIVDSAGGEKVKADAWHPATKGPHLIHTYLLNSTLFESHRIALIVIHMDVAIVMGRTRPESGLVVSGIGHSVAKRACGDRQTGGNR